MLSGRDVNGMRNGRRQVGGFFSRNCFSDENCCGKFTKRRSICFVPNHRENGSCLPLLFPPPVSNSQLISVFFLYLFLSSKTVSKIPIPLQNNPASAVRKKDDKIEMLAHERNFLWHLRRTTGLEIARAKDEVKTMITDMKIKYKRFSIFWKSFFRRVLLRTILFDYG